MNSSNSIPWENIVKLGQKTYIDSDWFIVSWILGRFCNYKCSYCWTKSRGDDHDFRTLPEYITTLNEIRRQAAVNGFTRNHWSLSGGEPTMFKDFNRLVEYIGSLDTEQSISITTNMSRGLEWWKQFCLSSSNVSIRFVTASFHDEYANESQFADRCKLLRDSGIYVIINQVMVPSQYSELYDRCSRFYDMGLNVVLKPQSNKNCSALVDGYTNEMLIEMQNAFPQRDGNGRRYDQMELITSSDDRFSLDSAERLNAHQFINFKGWTCNAGFQSAVIRKTEIIRSFTCSCQNLGTVDSFKLYKAPAVCIMEQCVTSADTKIPRCKND